MKKTKKAPVIKIKKTTISKLKDTALQNVKGGGGVYEWNQSTNPNLCSQVTSCD